MVSGLHLSYHFSRTNENRRRNWKKAKSFSRRRHLHIEISLAQRIIASFLTKYMSPMTIRLNLTHNDLMTNTSRITIACLSGSCTPTVAPSTFSKTRRRTKKRHACRPFIPRCRSFIRTKKREEIKSGCCWERAGDHAKR